MDEESYNEDYSLDGLQEAETALMRINQLLEQISAKQEKAVGELSNGVRRASRDIEKLNVKIERDTGRAISSMVTGTKSAAQAMRGVWQGFLDFFLTRIISKMNSALGGLVPGGGGIFGALFGGILSLFGLEEGGVVRGTRSGTPVIVGENFTDELVIPLSKLNPGDYAGRLTGSGRDRAHNAATPEPPLVNLYPRFVIENNSPLDADIEIYRLASDGKEALDSTYLDDKSAEVTDGS
ncbi:MAG: hypothetical protein GY771_14095 [bacterium]|nr:hypothetical protein [bacterium]